MKHASANALDRMPDLLTPLRRHPRLTERTTGAFYAGSTPFLHFCEEPVGGIVVTLRTRAKAPWKKLPVATPEQRRGVLAVVIAALAQGGAAPAPAASTKKSADPAAGKRAKQPLAAAQ